MADKNNDRGTKGMGYNHMENAVGPVELFLQFHYLKEQLVAYCKENGLATYGNKQELTDRIVEYLKTGEKTGGYEASFFQSREITTQDIVEENVVITERHRAFFQDAIGEGFKFHASFKKWLQENSGKTYGEAIQAWYDLREQRSQRNRKNTAPNALYHRYIRDFQEDNPELGFPDAVTCWSYKKSLGGLCVYDRADLIALEE